MAERYLCPVCKTPTAVTAALKFRKHPPGVIDPCPHSGLFVPAAQVELGPITDGADPGVPEEGRDYAICGECGRAVPFTPDGTLNEHDRVLRGGERCPSSGDTTSFSGRPPTPNASAPPFQQPSAPAALSAPPDAKAPAPASAAPSEPLDFPSGPTGASVEPEPLPGVDEYAEMLERFQRPIAPHPFQNADNGKRRSDPIVPMTPLAAEVAARLKETFYAYGNRKSADNRSAQTTLGPSEIGTPCDRRLALSLLRAPAVNPGGDGWAAFVGTCIHEGLAGMFDWANADTGRYAVETKLSFPSAFVPKGTGDLLDRTLMMFLDHKAMGQWSANKLRTKGPSDTYRVQVHTYAYGARLRGEKVEHVAIVAWPRDKSSLDDLYVWTEPYNPAVARDALARVDDIGERVALQPEAASPLDIGLTFPLDNSDCKFCPFHAPGDAKGMYGCDGKK